VIGAADERTASHRIASAATDERSNGNGGPEDMRWN
jgi:hypothetical protein